ncbi:MAG: tRNA (guanine(10)-N(2))-dimethyltransferase [Candidatus Thorarchaeota archaeon]|jgi:tRNA (guanine26-N2/guanine27-N2)-dimethyltransferase
MIVEKEYTEGRTSFLSADIDHYSANQKQPTTDLPVFYNPIMRLNRDLSVVFLRAYLQEKSVELLCEPLAGSGVRTLRYLNECPGKFNALMFDVNPTAVEITQKNIERHGFADRAQVKRGDAKVLLLTESRNQRFDFVDVDPFGSPVPYLNAAMQSLKPREGVLALTATDMPVLCGVYPSVALRKYGGLSMRAPFVHELAVRLLLGSAYSVAGMNDSSITPLAVLSTDHYVRVWLRIEGSRSEGNLQADRMGVIRYCKTCMHVETMALGELTQTRNFRHETDSCTGEPTVAGPLWTGDLFDRAMLDGAQKILNNEDLGLDKRVSKLLALMKEEADLTGNPYMDLHEVCDLHSLTPPKTDTVMQTLRERGHAVSRTHFRPTAIRTDASVGELAGAITDLSGVK